MQINIGVNQSLNSVVSGGAVMSNRSKQRRHAFRPNPDQLLLDRIEDLVLAGNQKDISVLFQNHREVPARLGEWELRVNIRLQDNVAVGRTIHAIPMTVRARTIFEEGSIVRLKSLGYTDVEARTYYKYAWRKKYVWTEAVLTCVKELIDSFQVENVLESYEVAGDPRRLAHSTGVPANPYTISHDHFLVAIEMARRIIRSRRGKDAATAFQKVAAPEPDDHEMVAV